MIELAGVAKSFETRNVTTRALRGVELKVERGAYVAVQGASGSGKSTLLNVLGLLDGVDDGSYRLDGREMAGLRAAERAAVRAQNIGFVFQSFNLIGEIDVLENVQLPMKFAGLRDRRARRERAASCLRRVGLDNRMTHYPGQLSGGQQQRVAIARAIAGTPKLLLTDEPTGNLDSATGAEIMRLLESLHQDGMTIIMVTHEPAYAARAEFRFQMNDGVLTPG